MSATAIASSSDEPPFISVSITGLTDHIGGTLTCFRLNPDGTSEPVRQADPNVEIDAAEMALIDYEAPLGAAVSYRTLAVADLESDLEQLTSPVTLTTAEPWLVHPGTPALSQVLRVKSLATRDRAVAQSVHTPIGRQRPIVFTDGALKAPQGTLELSTWDLAERDALLTLLQGLTPLLLNIPTGLGWGITSEWVSFSGVSERAISGKSQARLWSLPYLVVDRPVGAVNIARTWADVLNEAATWAELKNLYATYLGVLTGQEGT